jgi:hypothetical protein
MFSVRKTPLNMDCQSFNLGDIKIANTIKIMISIEELVLVLVVDISNIVTTITLMTANFHIRFISVFL